MDHDLFASRVAGIQSLPIQRHEHPRSLQLEAIPTNSSDRALATMRFSARHDIVDQVVPGRAIASTRTRPWSQRHVCQVPPARPVV